MRLTKCKTRLMFFIILTIISCLYTSAFADTWPKPNKSSTTESDRLFGFGGTISYVGPYVWRGIPLTRGPCFQPVIWGSFWEFSLGMFMNMFGSKKDLQYGPGVFDPDPLNLSRDFFRCNQIKFYLDWEHEFNEYFSLYTAYTHLAFAEHKDEYGLFDAYKWFDKRSTYGELTIRPSVQVGPWNIFTEQNLVIVAVEHDVITPGITQWWDTTVVNDAGNYHSAYGVTLAKEVSDNFAVAMTISEELANRGFLSKMVKKKTDVTKTKGIKTWGFYQTTITLKTRFHPVSWFSFSANYGVEFVTNNAVSVHTMTRGALLFGGMHTTLSW